MVRLIQRVLLRIFVDPLVAIFNTQRLRDVDDAQRNHRPLRQAVRLATYLRALDYAPAAIELDTLRLILGSGGVQQCCNNEKKLPVHDYVRRNSAV